MKKSIAILLSILCTFSLLLFTGCDTHHDDILQTTSKAQNKPADKTLVVYTPDSDQTLELLIPPFEQKYGIKVDIISASTGECLSRIQSEIANPQADIMQGAMDTGYYLEYPDLFEKYISPNDSKYPDDAKNNTGCITYYDTNVNVLIVNNDVLKQLGVSVAGYSDLLQPALKGKIISADPTSSSSAWRQLTNMLLVNGGYESDEAWAFVGKLIEQLNGVLSSSSSNVYKSVADGEYAVGITYEEPCLQLIKDGAKNISIVYCKEGTTTNPTGTAIVKNAPHMENAKLFIDYLSSDEVQQRYESSTARAANRNINAKSCVERPAWDEMKTVPENLQLRAEKKPAIIQHWTDLWAEKN